MEGALRIEQASKCPRVHLVKYIEMACSVLSAPVAGSLVPMLLRQAQVQWASDNAQRAASIAALKTPSAQVHNYNNCTGLCYFSVVPV